MYRFGDHNFTKIINIILLNGLNYEQTIKPLKLNNLAITTKRLKFKVKSRSSY